MYEHYTPLSKTKVIQKLKAIHNRPARTHSPMHVVKDQGNTKVESNSQHFSLINVFLLVVKDQGNTKVESNSQRSYWRTRGSQCCQRPR